MKYVSSVVAIDLRLSALFTFRFISVILTIKPT